MEKKPLYIKPIAEAEALQIKERYLCASCWRHLEAHFAPGRLYYVLCTHCGPDTRGYVTRAYVERRQAEAGADASEARRNLAGLVPGFENPHQGKSSDELLKELGF